MTAAKPQSAGQLVIARTKEAEVLRRRIAGQTFRVIAAELDYSVAGAYDAFKRAMAATVLPVQEAADELRVLIRERLNADLDAIEDRRAAGDPDAIRTHLAIIKAQRELEGLDAATQIVGDVTVRYEVVGLNPNSLR